MNVVHEASSSTNALEYMSIYVMYSTVGNKREMGCRNLRSTVYEYVRSAPELVVVERHVRVAVVEAEDEAAAHLRDASAVHRAGLHRREAHEQVREAHAVLAAHRQRPASRARDTKYEITYCTRSTQHTIRVRARVKRWRV